MSDKWIGWARDAMAERKWSQADLARAVGCDRVFVHRLLEKKQWTRWCNEIADKLEIAHPYVLVDTEEESDWIEAGRVLAEHKPKLFQEWLSRVRELAVLVEKSAEAEQRIDEIAPPDPSDPRATS